MDKSKAKISGMFSTIACRYDLINSVLSLGIHHIWKKKLTKIVNENIPSGVVLDLCTGTGDLVAYLAKFQTKVYAADFSENMLIIAKEKNKEFSNVEFSIQDAMNLQYESDFFDAVTVSFGVRNFEDLQQGLREIHRVLKPGAKIYILEFGQPQNFLIRTIFQIYSKFIMPVVGAIFVKNSSAYSYLQESSKNFPSGANFAKILHDVGFKNTTFNNLTTGISYIYQAVK